MFKDKTILENIKYPVTILSSSGYSCDHPNDHVALPQQDLLLIFKVANWQLKCPYLSNAPYVTKQVFPLENIRRKIFMIRTLLLLSSFGVWRKPQQKFSIKTNKQKSSWIIETTKNNNNFKVSKCFTEPLTTPHPPLHHVRMLGSLLVQMFGEKES